MRGTREGRQELKQEVQANQFAIELLAPAPKFEARLSDGPDLKDAERACDALDISVEAAVRRLVELRPEALAAVWSQIGRKPGGVEWAAWFNGHYRSAGDGLDRRA